MEKHSLTRVYLTILMVGNTLGIATAATEGVVALESALLLTRSELRRTQPGVIGESSPGG